jgi:hypothetical protein
MGNGEWQDGSRPEKMEALGPFVKELELRIDNPDGGDECIAAFAEACIDEIQQTESPFGACLVEYLVNNSIPGETKLPNKVPKLLRAIDKQILCPEWREDPNNPKFPDDFEDKDSWRYAINWILADVYRKEDFCFDLLTRDVASNVKQRYVSVPFVVGLYRALQPERFVEPPRILDAGCSQKDGTDALVGKLPFEEVVITRGNQRSGIRHDDEGTDYFNQTVALNSEVGPSWGVDKHRPDDPLVRKWAYACSRYPGEFKGVDIAAEQEELERKGNSGLDNFCEWDFVKSAEPPGGEIEDGSMDLVFASNTLYLVKEKLRPRAVKNLSKKLNPETGLLVSFEAAYLKDSHKVPRMFSRQHVKPFRFRVHTLDMSDRDKRWRELLNYRGGRCREAQWGGWAITTLIELGVPIDTSPVKR